MANAKFLDVKEEQMPLFITQGRFTQDAMKGMLAKPEDRAEAARILAFMESLDAEG